MRIYHGSAARIERPEYGKGKPYNDYGPGFYCTEDIEMAKEWGCGEDHGGFANCYEIDMTGLKLLYLNAPEYTILHWLTVLLQNRTFHLTNPIAKDARDYLLEHFSVNARDCDIIIGYRADDSYFAFAEDFLNNAISVKKLEKAMRLGNLGEQVVLISQEAFDRIRFLDAQRAGRDRYYALRAKRDQAARAECLSNDRKPRYGRDELYMLDLMRQEVRADDPRLR